MKLVTLFLMTKKGLAFLDDVVDVYRPLIEEVVVGADSALDCDHFDDIVALCEARGIRWSRRTTGHAIRTAYVMAVGWRWLIEHPQDRLIVFHDSLLPHYRGFNPLVTALINGDSEVGVTALKGTHDYDAGPILAQARISVQYPLTIAAAIDALRGAYRECAHAVFASLASGAALHGTVQDESRATYSLWRDEEDYRMPWAKSAIWLERFVDAVGSPYRGASCLVNGAPARITKARALPDAVIANRVPGKVVRISGEFPVVVCGEGLIEICSLVDEQGQSLLPLTRFRTRFS